MSVIAWDGKILAADRRAMYGDTIHTVRKIFKLETGEILAFAGDLDQGMTLIRWYREGYKRHEFPRAKDIDDKAFCLLCIVIGKKLFYYERTPEPIESLDEFTAFGCGREVAIGAMAMGATAIKAVAVASRFISACGNGCDYFMA